MAHLDIIMDKLSCEIADVLLMADLAFMARIVLYKELVDLNVLPNVNVSLALNGMCGQTMITTKNTIEIMAHFPFGTRLSELTLAIAKFGCKIEKIK